MAKTSMIEKEKKRINTVQKFSEKRLNLKSKIQDSQISYEERIYLIKELQKLPRDASPTRLQKRCRLTGRPHGFYRKFGLGRNKLREAAMRGDIPGLRKASW